MTDNDFRVNIDETHKLITFRFKGDAPSAGCVDAMIDTFRALDKPWTYSQMLDYRQFNSLLQVTDLERLSKYWIGAGVPAGTRIKVVVLSSDPLIQVRSPTFGTLFPEAEIRITSELFEALDWLYAKRATAA